MYTKFFIFILLLLLLFIGCGEKDGNSDCQNGYFLKNNICVDIDECEKNEDACSEHAKCINLEGSFSCECKIGFVGDEKSGCTLVKEDLFITTWDTTKHGISEFNEIYIPTAGGGYNYDIDCDNDGVFEAINVTKSYTCKYKTAGIYQVAIAGDFPQIYFDSSRDVAKILSIDQWGKIEWRSMENSFAGCYNLVGKAQDKPNISRVTNFHNMFAFTGFNQNINDWDMSQATDISGMFKGNGCFNQPLDNWSLSKVTDMSSLFLNAESFNQNINSWDVSSVTNMNSMFYVAKSFNQDLSSWDVSNVTDMKAMFYLATQFNGDISTWNVSKVTTMSVMFIEANSFNSNISSWDVGNVINMDLMFYAATSFKQDISSWNVDNVVSCYQFDYAIYLSSDKLPNFINCSIDTYED
ncbi:BspA family leucine-rich repeat surface protein [bacterium]|nr:BspA family leucine-rich repeat surface protein [bacterium]